MTEWLIFSITDSRLTKNYGGFGMKMVNEKPVLGRKVGEDVIWETNVEEKYVFLHLHEGGAYVVPRSVVYRTRDGRYAVNYKILQNSGVFLVGNTTVEKAVADLEDAYDFIDDTLNTKFAEYGLKIKNWEQGNKEYVYYIELTNGKKVYY